jgi:DNA-directed RNA polymerase subunit M/transcription elongation factor TFIIS
MDFCPQSFMLLEEITSQEKLLFKSGKTGTVYEANPEHTLLAREGVSELQSISKFKNTLKVSAYDPINPKERLSNGCEKCGRKIVSLQRLGEDKKVVYTCLCGYTFSV